MLKKNLTILSALVMFGFSFADSLIVGKSGYSTYIQKAEFILPEGESVVGPIKLLPYSKTDSLLINPQQQDVSVVGYVLEESRDKTLNAVVGKNVSLEGDGRVINGTVISVKDGYITMDTKKGTVITTLPVFPGRVSTLLNWQESLAPKITVKLKSSKPKNIVIDLRYPLEGFSYHVHYVANIEKNQLLLQEFYRIVNETPLNLKDIELYVKEGDKLTKLYNKTYIEPFSVKVLNTKTWKLDISGKSAKLPVSNVTVSLYKDGIFTGDIKVSNNTLNVP